ncbi:hypothetical protein NSQ93_23000 [Bacillus sp. FSL W8-0445]|jgi:hypothetical protein|uniref:Uncharacterized protein n=1 Tax=Bacillus licheniformis TaxID=1402 RepID=A0AB37GQJ3_BACLI|nr:MULTISPECIES: hypothetical protein [Bacillus]AMR09487.1 hypothetical protein AB684_04650 [Bacillus licheniformis]AWV39752.1 hypothetical protein CD200_04730 [Bacillus licheniformis]AZN80449.1 hypothetical protein CXG95_15560 [Bacillus licheniformis]KUL09616.1 hypothetical protein LI17339_13770 [Bacillus licheniformis LMG 17339]MCC2133200.1 hypothetical protein [Bacillus licheniformis]
MNVYYRRTVVGWWNVYPAGSDDQFANLNPEEFTALLPQVSRRAFAGCAEISLTAARELFGKEVRSA